jgi:hypothetical protein
MSENLVCLKCQQRFKNQEELQKHAQHCTGKGAQQSGKDRPMTHGAGGQGASQ